MSIQAEKRGTFAHWLVENKATYRTQFQTAIGDGSRFAGIRTLAEAQEVIDSDATLQTNEKQLCQTELARAYLDYDRRHRNRFAGFFSFGSAIFLLMVSVLGIISAGIFVGMDASLLSKLGNIGTARGLITFIFTVGVVSLAIIIVTANFIATDQEEKAFDRAKEIFTALIAILGTILGFYFGAETGRNTPEDQQEIGDTRPASTPSDGAGN